MGKMQPHPDSREGGFGYDVCELELMDQLDLVMCSWDCNFKTMMRGAQV